MMFPDGVHDSTGEYGKSSIRENWRQEGRFCRSVRREAGTVGKMEPWLCRVKPGELKDNDW